MSSNPTFVKLPALKRIEVENYPLFTKSWKYSVKNGMNLFIGTNGLGKTTTTALIIYGLVGPTEEIPVDYFENRGAIDKDSKKSPLIKLSFEIEAHSFEIHRIITEDKIIFLKVDDHLYSSEDLDHIDEIFEALMIQYSGIGSLADIGFLLRRFIIREEEGNYLIWDDKGGDQSKLIRILINEKGFEAEYELLARKVKDLDTSVRGKTDVKAQFTKRIVELQELRDKELETRKDYDERLELEKSLGLANVENDSNIEIRDKNLENIKYLTDQIRDADGKIEAFSAEYEGYSDEIRQLEGKLFKHIYSDEKVLTSVHKLKHYGLCIYCNKSPDKSVVDKIVYKLEIKNQCPVCESTLDLVHPDLDNSDLLEKLELVQKKVANAKGEITPLKGTKKQLTAELDAVWTFQNKLEKDINILSIKQYDLKIKLANLNKNPEEQITIYDTQIAALSEQVKKYESEIEPEKEKFDVAKDLLEAKNLELSEVITAFEDKLNLIFTKYASKYFKSDCQLTTIERRPRESKINVKSYVPEFGGKKRVAMKDCSTSERIFLEYLFRISLLELYAAESQTTPFIIMETTEGAFDMSNTVQLASSFNEFSKRGIPFILITNFSKQDFLIEISKGIEKSKDRLLNFLDFGKLDEQHKSSLPLFKKVLGSLKLTKV
ncbi:hypothetical protein [Pedobacter panaciterrae]|uniref:hypothetical protein n=1 Tax=Pedobacter panaciterrae TaxID=363849 RepID=UPI00259319F5|nr:hypothetical protein [uncultured Pedobacter sp.]